MITPLLTASTHSSTPIAPVSNGVGQTPTPPSVLSGENHQTSASDTLPTIPPTTLIPKGEPQVPRSSPQSALADSILQALWLTPFFSLPLFAHLGNMIKNAFSSREQAVGVEAGIAKKPEAVFDELRTSRLVLDLRFALLMAKIKFPKNSKPWAKINSAMDQANELNKAFTRKKYQKKRRLCGSASLYVIH